MCYEVGLTWRDKIGKDFKYHVGINTGYGDNKVLNMDFETEYLYRQIQKGHRSDIGTWGMQCLGMFRSFQDIEEYFTKYNMTSYLGMAKDKVRPGMLIYKDVRGAQQADGTYAAPDGIVDKDNDQGVVFGSSTNADASNRITINKLNSALNRDVHWDKSYKANVGVLGSLVSPFLGRPLLFGLNFSFSTFTGFSLSGIFVASLAL